MVWPRNKFPKICDCYHTCDQTCETCVPVAEGYGVGKGLKIQHHTLIYHTCTCNTTGLPIPLPNPNRISLILFYSSCCINTPASIWYVFFCTQQDDNGNNRWWMMLAETLDDLELQLQLPTTNNRRWRTSAKGWPSIIDLSNTTHPTTLISLT